MLCAVFDADAAELRSHHRSVANVTCLRPAAGTDGSQLFDDSLLDAPLETGRVCRGGACDCACSRVRLSRAATSAECARVEALAAELMDADVGPMANLYLKYSAAAGKLPLHLTLLRLVERLRRAVAHEYGVPLHTLTPRQAFVSRISGGSDVPSYTQLHVDESSTSAFHYSAVLYLSDRDVGAYTGGELLFADPCEAGASDGHAHTRLAPRRGEALVFSSGWENKHAVTEVTSGVRYALPAFFTTEPSLEASLPWADGDDLNSDGRESARFCSRAEALWQLALMPTTLEDYLLFVANWPSMFPESIGSSCMDAARGLGLSRPPADIPGRTDRERDFYWARHRESKLTS